MKNFLSLSIAIAALLILGLGCSKLATGGADLFEGDNAQKAADQIKQKVGSEQVKVISVEIHKDQMEVTIQSPKNPKDIDKYTYKNGSVTGPEPVKVFSMGNLDMTADKYDTTDISQIGFANIPATVKQAIEASKLENGEVNTISMENEVPAGGTLGKSKLVLKWRLFIEGPRGRKDFWADKDGKLDPKSF